MPAMSSTTEPGQHLGTGAETIRSGPFPVPNATVPFWRTELHDLDSHQSAGTLPSEQDIVIIGAGYAGAAIAFYLRGQEINTPSVTVLEAREACSGATGRNGGHIRPDVHLGLPARIRKYGREAADGIAEFEVANLHAVRDLVQARRIDCDFRMTTTMTVFSDETLAAAARLDLDELLRLGSPTAKLVHYTGGEAAETFSGVNGAKAVFSFQAGSIWPYKFVMHLLADAVERGVQLHTHTRVTAVSAAPDQDGYWTVSTQRGDTRAKRVIFATNGYTPALLPEYRDRIVPVRGICAHVGFPEGAEPPHLPSTYSVRHAPNLYDYQVTRPDGSIVVGGARTVVIPRVEEWYDVSDDSRLIEPAVAYFDGLLQRTFRGWKGTEASVNGIWTGIMGYTNDLRPHIGAVPSKPGQFICAGFNGHGMSFVLLSARGLAKMIREDIPFGETGIPHLFETSDDRLRQSGNDILPLAGHRAREADTV